MSDCTADQLKAQLKNWEEKARSDFKEVSSVKNEPARKSLLKLLARELTETVDFLKSADWSLSYPKIPAAEFAEIQATHFAVVDQIVLEVLSALQGEMN